MNEVKGTLEIKNVEEMEQWLKSNPWHHKLCFQDVEEYTSEYMAAIVNEAPREYMEDGIIKLMNQKKSLVNVSQNIRKTVYTPTKYSNTIYFFGDSRIQGYGSEDKYTIQSFLQEKLNKQFPETYLVVNKGIKITFTNIFVEMIKRENYRPGDIVFLGLSLRLFRGNYREVNGTKEILTEIFYTYLNEINMYLKTQGVKFYFCIMPIVSDVKAPSAVEMFLQKEVFPNHQATINLDEIYFDRLYRVNGITVIDLRKLVQRPHRQGDYFIDHSHYAHRGNSMFADEIFKTLEIDENLIQKRIQTFKNTYEQMSLREFKGLENKGLEEYLRELDTFNIRPYTKNGAIVMNCNPFTNGHKYLIQTAAKQVDHLFVFIVEEDKSVFPFEVRKKLVEGGTKNLANVTVIASGKYIISSITFPEYFSKDFLQEDTIDCSKDLTIFCEKIAPRLNIRKRFVGTEPNCKITNQYNQQMKEILPTYGIELVEIERLKEEDRVISASHVRKLMEMGEHEQLRKIVPESTYNYLNLKMYKEEISN